MAKTQRQKLQNSAVVQPPRAVHASGGTSAPRSAAGSGTSGLGHIQVAPNPGRVGPGHGFGAGPSAGGAGGAAAPAGTPAPRGALPPPETQQRLRQRDEGNTALIDSEGDYKYGLYQAALKYGDPSVIGLYGDAADPPTGATQEIAKREKLGQKTNANNRNANNTFFSGMNLDDIQNISDEANNERSRALQEFEAAKHALDEAWKDAQDKHRWEEEQYNEEAQGEFNASEPQPQAAAPAPGGSSAAPPAKKGPGKAPNYAAIIADPWRQKGKKGK